MAGGRAAGQLEWSYAAPASPPHAPRPSTRAWSPTGARAPSSSTPSPSGPTERGVHQGAHGTLAGRLDPRQGRHEVPALFEGRRPTVSWEPVPACPGWSIGAFTAHLVGVAEDAARGGFCAGAMDVGGHRAGAGREESTAGRLVRHARRTRDALLRELERREPPCRASSDGSRRRSSTSPAGCSWPRSATSPYTSADLREALGVPPDPSSPVSRFGRDLPRLAAAAARARRATSARAARRWEGVAGGRGRPAGAVTAKGHGCSG